MKIGVLGKKSKVKTELVIEEIISSLQSWGYEPVRFHSPNEIDGVDVVIILGGDGAILHSAVTSAKNGVKLIGINYGNLGFLTEYEKDEQDNLKELLQSLDNGTCRILRRSLLELELFGKKFYALNEISLQRDYGLYSPSTTQILRVEVQTLEGVSTVSGDGVLLCTPTGSTAYSLSAGGAILTPEVPVFMLTPICAFSMRARPTVFSDTQEFTMKITRGKAILQADGLAVSVLNEGDEIKVRKAPFTADFPTRANSDFFTKVKNKLSE